MCKQNTVPVKVTLRPRQIKKVKKLARTLDDRGNFSLALRLIIDRFEG